MARRLVRRFDAALPRGRQLFCHGSAGNGSRAAGSCLLDNAGSFDSFAQLNDHLVASNFEYSAADTIPGNRVLRKLIPRSGLELFQAELQAPCLGICGQDHGADGLADFHDLARMFDPLLTREFRNMDEALNALLHLNKRAELRQARDFAFDYFSAGIAVPDRVPRISQDLAKPEAQSRTGRIDLQITASTRSPFFKTSLAR